MEVPEPPRRLPPELRPATVPRQSRAPRVPKAPPNAQLKALDNLPDVPEYPQWKGERSLAKQIVSHWKNNARQTYQELLDDGNLVQTAIIQAESTIRLARNLSQTGVDPWEAWDEAMQEVALTPR